MTELKREYVVPLRRKTKLAPKWRRSKKAVSVLNEFIKKHMKTDTVIICSELNEKIWENGIKNPPGKVSVIALKTKINGVEKTLVNLKEFGIDKQLGSYVVQSNITQEEVSEEKAEDKKEEVSKEKKVVEAEVKEKKSPVKKEEKKKEEVKKDE